MSDDTFHTALVTGSARRIGRAIALQLADHGWSVAVHYNTSADEARELIGEIAERDVRSAAFKADLSNEKETAGLLARVVEELGPVTCLINNASVFEEDTLETTTRESWDTHMLVNLRAPFVLTQAFTAQKPQDIEGNVINIIDQRVWNLTPRFTSYTVSKAALWALTRTLAQALAPGIRVNAIGPGPTLPSAHQSEEQFTRQWSSLPLGRRVLPEEIGEAVCFILEAPAMTGQMIALDGGQHMGRHQRFETGITNK